MQAPTRGNVGHDHLLFTARVEISGLVGEPDHGVGLADVHPFRIRSRRMERDSKRALEALHKYLVAFRLRGSVLGAQDADPSRRAFRNEQVAVRGNADEPWVVETARE